MIGHHVLVDPLAGVEAKLARAVEHFGEFERDSTAFFEGQPPPVVQELDPESGWHVGRYRSPEPPPLRFGVIAGEIVGQCRTALDHLMAAAVRLDHPTTRKPPHFPIFHDRAKWVDPKTEGGLKELQRRLRPEHLDIVDQVQPYRFGADSRTDALSLLQVFNNIDKHDVVNVAYIAVKALGRAQLEWRVDAVRFPADPLNLTDGAELYRLHFPEGSEPHDGFRLTLGLSMILANGSGMNDSGLAFLVWFTAKVVDDFRVATPEFAPSSPRTDAASLLWQPIMEDMNDDRASPAT